MCGVPKPPTCRRSGRAQRWFGASLGRNLTQSRKVAKSQSRKADSASPEWQWSPARPHRTVGPTAGAQGWQNPCFFAPLRLCVKSFQHSYYLRRRIHPACGSWRGVRSSRVCVCPKPTTCRRSGRAQRWSGASLGRNLTQSRKVAERTPRVRNGSGRPPDLTARSGPRLALKAGRTLASLRLCAFALRVFSIVMANPRRAGCKGA